MAAIGGARCDECGYEHSSQVVVDGFGEPQGLATELYGWVTVEDFHQGEPFAVDLCPTCLANKLPHILRKLTRLHKAFDCAVQEERDGPADDEPWEALSNANRPHEPGGVNS